MQKRNLLLSLLLFVYIQGIAQKTDDSLVIFSDIKFHSDFERDAIRSFVINGKDTFNLFLAVDENIKRTKAKQYFNVYNKIYQKLEDKNIEKKKLTKKIKLTYSTVHSYFLKKYNDLEYFSSIFQDGTYNCVSASMLYSMILDNLNIPYKVQASSNHVYIVANPGENSIVIETTNPMFENAIFTGEFKRQYVNHLKESKLISKEDIDNKSVEEIFEQKFNEVRDAEFSNLPGFQYYNKAIEKAKNNEIQEAYQLCQKAYYFYPDNQVKTLLYNILIAQLGTCRYKKVEDIDLLVHLSRFNSNEPEVFSGLMYEILSEKLQYLGNEMFCDSLYKRFNSKCKNQVIKNEVGFTYNIQMYEQNKNSEKGEKYLENALLFKSNHKAAINQFNFLIRMKLEKIYNNNILLDSIVFFEKKYSFDFVKPILEEYKMKAYLRTAKDYFEKNKITLGNKYLLLFEQNWTPLNNNTFLEYEIENTYRKAALYYYYRNNKKKTKEYVERGLKYVPSSKLLKSLR